MIRSPRVLKVLVTAATAAMALTFLGGCNDAVPSGGNGGVNQQDDDDDDDDDHRKKRKHKR